jgi:hypothetical protein
VTAASSGIAQQAETNNDWWQIDIALSTEHQSVSQSVRSRHDDGADRTPQHSVVLQRYTLTHTREHTHTHRTRTHSHAHDRPMRGAVVCQKDERQDDDDDVLRRCKRLLLLLLLLATFELRTSII